MNSIQQSNRPVSGRRRERYAEEAAPSYRPILVAFAAVLIAIGVIYSPVISAVGLLLLLINIAGWVQENRDDPHPKEDPDGQDA